MDRLTKRVDGIAVLESWAVDKDPVSVVQRLCSALAAYEDFMDRWHLKSIEDAERIFRRVNDLGGTDLMAQYRELGSINHLRDLLQAEKSGQLVVLPCKVGDTVYWLHNGFITECRVHRIQMNRTGLFICLKSKVSHGAFRVDICLGKTVFLTREEAEAALAGKNIAEPDAPEEPSEPEWKRQFMRTFLGGR